MEADHCAQQAVTLHPFSPLKRPQKGNLDAEVSSLLQYLLQRNKANLPRSETKIFLLQAHLLVH